MNAPAKRPYRRSTVFRVTAQCAAPDCDGTFPIWKQNVGRRTLCDAHLAIQKREQGTIRQRRRRARLKGW